MTEEYDNTNRGALWPNPKYEAGGKHPRFRGSVNVNGVDYWVSMWADKVDESSNRPSVTLALHAKEPKPAVVDTYTPGADLDDIPW